MTSAGDVLIPSNAGSALDEIPIFDATACFGGEPGALVALADQVRRAQEEIGFYYLTGHGVPQDLIDRTFAAIERFFALPDNEKISLKVNEHQIGYIPPKASLLKTSGIADNTKLDTNEAFQLMRDRSPSDPKVVDGIRFNGLNQWPDEARAPGLRDTMAEYHDVMSQLGWRMLPVYSAALGLEPNHLFQYFRDPHFINRNAHYAPGTAEENQFGLAPHSDHGFVTFLPLSDVPGLEVKTQGGDWIAAPHVPGAMLVNTGEFLNRWTNGRFIATPHRVLVPERDRYTITFFYNPSDETVNTPISTCVDADNPARFEPTTFIRYLKDYAEGNYLHQAEYAKRQNVAG
ncbi:MAG: isopenicillin N synthase family oxygenase [Alphaproteobacteria bacterium]|nr:isopenicillin N synthase family oxygenase [Alphaproteobacteria bacterium]